MFVRLVCVCDDLDSLFVFVMTLFVFVMTLTALSSTGQVVCRLSLIDCLSVWVCLIFLLSSFLGYTAVWVLRGGPQW